MNDRTGGAAEMALDPSSQGDLVPDPLSRTAFETAQSSRARETLGTDLRLPTGQDIVTGPIVLDGSDLRASRPN